jgi:predicted CopG family antitoxin
MKRKTISIDHDVYRQIRGRQLAHESLSAALRRVLEEEKDPADYLDELVKNPPSVDVAVLRRRKANPVRSSRPSKWKRARRAA